jgi:HK97 family phage prohead protease
MAMANMFEKLEQAVSDRDYSFYLKDSSTEDSKQEIRRDVFSTAEEAEERAEEIGCQGFHSHDEDGNTVYMPCATHDQYEELTGDEVNGKSDEDPEVMEEDLDAVITVQSEIKAYEDEEEDKEFGEFEGYASVFNNTDLGNDVIKNGAFLKSIKKRGPKNVKLLYQHKSDMPIGVYDSIKEDSHGLYVKGRLALKTTAGRDAYELLKMGALDGLSIGFRANPDQVSYDKRSRKRIIKEVDLMEISLVTFPMNPKAKIQSVKGEEISIREWENGLRDAFSLSRSEAKVAAKAVNEAFSDQREVESGNAELVDAIKNLTDKLTSI